MLRPLGGNSATTRPGARGIERGCRGPGGSQARSTHCRAPDGSARRGSALRTHRGAEQPTLAEQDQVSSAGELHPRALPEPYVSLSAHTAPINQPSASHRGKRLCPVPPAPPVASWPASGAGRRAPFAPPTFIGFLATTRHSAPVPRLGTSPLGRSAPLRGSLCIGTTGSHVPQKSPSQAHAAFMPDTTQVVSRAPPGLLPG